MAIDQSNEQKRGHRIGTERVYVCMSIFICHLKNAELEPQFQKYKGRVVLRGDLVKNDAGSYAAFTEQGIISITNDRCKRHGYHIHIARVRRTSSGRSICLYPSKNGRCSQIIENSKIGVSRHLDSSTTTQMAKNHGPLWKTQSFLLNEIFTVILWQDYYGKSNSRKFHSNTVSNWECFSSTEKKELLLSVYVDDVNLAGKKQNINPMWKVLNKEVHLGEPTSFLDHVYLGCTQRQCEVSQDIVDNYRTMFESRISAGGTEKLPFSQNTRISSWSYDMEGHAKKCVEKYCELANKTTEQFFKVATPCMDDHQFREEENGSVGELIVHSLLTNGSKMSLFGTCW